MKYAPGHSISYYIECEQWRFRQACTSAQSNQSSQGTLWVAKDPNGQEVDS